MTYEKKTRAFNLFKLFQRSRHEDAHTDSQIGRYTDRDSPQFYHRSGQMTRTADFEIMPTENRLSSTSSLARWKYPQSPVPSVYRAPQGKDYISNLATPSRQSDVELDPWIGASEIGSRYPAFPYEHAVIPQAYPLHISNDVDSAVSRSMQPTTEQRTLHAAPIRTGWTDHHLGQTSLVPQPKASLDSTTNRLNEGDHKWVVYEHVLWDIDANRPGLIHYIVPVGLDVVFNDEDGFEIARLGTFTNTAGKQERIHPIIIQDEHGNELYRAGEFDKANPFNSPANKRSKHESQEDWHARSSVGRIVPLPQVIPREFENVILINGAGKQIRVREGGKNVLSPARYF